ncbi:M48 family metallopeptidase [Profundibacter sp.]|uniref:M48 family metallopeptidase n=1 Tax=Profundibacter sp. TaxID=3101071 RepID=UPI003D10DA1E
MEQIELTGPPLLTVTLRRSRRSRRLSLRVSQLDGRVTMSLPLRTPLREARMFAQEKEGWIRQTLSKRPDAARPVIGGQVLFEGREVDIVIGKGRVAKYVDGQIAVPNNSDRVAPRLVAFLKLTARMRLREASDRYAAALGTSYGRLTIRDTRSRWGSCSSEGNLMYSWRLIMAPPEVLDYVAAHEVSHLMEMNHSPDYWRVVASIYPDYKAPRVWLRQNGSLLHRYRFLD